MSCSCFIKSSLRPSHSTRRPTISPANCFYLQGIRHCLHDPGEFSPKKNHSEATCYCASLGGQLPEAATLEDLMFVRGMKTSGNIWVNAYTPAVGTEGYRWSRGDVVDTSLWGVGEPNHLSAQSNENCVSLWPQERRLFNVWCDYLSSHVICDVIV